MGEVEESVFEELRAARYNTNTEKQIACEPKEKPKARLKRSPDGADAAIVGLEVEPQLMNAGYVGVISERDVLPPEDFDEPINFGLG